MKDFFTSISNYFKALFAIMITVFFPLSLLLIAYPKAFAEALLFGFFMLSVIICILIQKRKINLDWLESFSIFALLVYTQIIHVSLLAHKSNDHLLINRFAQTKLFPEYAAFSTLANFIIISGLIIFVSIFSLRKIAETSKRFSLDTKSIMSYDIDNKLNSGRITKNEAAKEKDKILSNINYCSEREGIFKTVFTCMIAFITLTVIHFFAGICSDMCILKFIFSEALVSNIPLTIGVAYPFIILFILFTITSFWSKK